jgi:hypothetical protein
VFWFEVTPEGYGFGLGCYSAKASTMAKHRARIDRHPEALSALVRNSTGRRSLCWTGRIIPPKGDPGLC